MPYNNMVSKDFQSHRQSVTVAISTSKSWGLLGKRLGEGWIEQGAGTHRNTTWYWCSSR